MAMSGKQLFVGSLPADRIASAIAGGGIGYTSGVLNVNVDQGLEVSGDNVRISATGSVTHTAGVHTHTTETLQITGTPNSANDPINKSTLDASLEARSWKQPAEAKDYVGTRTIAEINALGSPLTGTSVVAGDGGVPTLGASDTLVAGDVAEFNGSEWKIIVTNAANFPPAGTRLLVSNLTLNLPLIEATDENKFADFDGASLTPTVTAPANGDGILIRGGGSVNENGGFAFDSTPGLWNQNAGGVITAGQGMVQAGNVFNIGDAGKGIQINANDLEFDAAESVHASGGLEVSANTWQMQVKRDVTSGGNVKPVSVVANGVGVDASAFEGFDIEAVNGAFRIKTAAAGNGIAGGGGTALSVDETSTLDFSPSGALSVATQTAGNNTNLAASTAFVTDAVATAGGSISTNERDETPTNAVGDGATTGITLTSNPDGDVRLEINGLGETIGGNKLSAAYFSVDGGTTARALGSAIAGDQLIWNGAIAGYDLAAASDKASLLYEV